MTMKALFFVVHRAFFVVAFIGVLFSAWVLIVHPIVAASWLANDNKCLVCELEHYLFGSTVLGEGKAFVVPWRNRYLLFVSFLAGSVLHGAQIIFPSLSSVSRDSSPGGTQAVVPKAQPGD